ncbi:MAG TPA: hypothetical protein VFF73_37185 [Planctomycetota bacterium]|nr:hypothetical protein [Planctomycetota bacterium]
MRLLLAIPVLALLAFASGCKVHEYVVAKDEVPLYATPTCDRVVDRMPLGHHEAVEDTDVPDVVKVTFNGRTGYAKKSDLRLLSYMHPQLDEGADREQTVGRAVRDVSVKSVGAEWPDEVKEAIRDGRVLDGMTREQVELAWGWPRTIEPLAVPAGGERWIFRRRGYESFDGAPAAARHFHPNRGASSTWGLESSPTYYRLPVVEERVVEFAGEKVVRSYVRRYYDVEGLGEE